MSSASGSLLDKDKARRRTALQQLLSSRGPLRNSRQMSFKLPVLCSPVSFAQRSTSNISPVVKFICSQYFFGAPVNISSTVEFLQRSHESLQNSSLWRSKFFKFAGQIINFRVVCSPGRRLCGRALIRSQHCRPSESLWWWRRWWLTGVRAAARRGSRGTVTMTATHRDAGTARTEAA